MRPLDTLLVRVLFFEAVAARVAVWFKERVAESVAFALGVADGVERAEAESVGLGDADAVLFAGGECVGLADAERVAISEADAVAVAESEEAVTAPVGDAVRETVRDTVRDADVVLRPASTSPATDANDPIATTRHHAAISEARSAAPRVADDAFDFIFRGCVFFVPARVELAERGSRRSSPHQVVRDTSSMRFDIQEHVNSEEGVHVFVYSRPAHDKEPKNRVGKTREN